MEGGRAVLARAEARAAATRVSPAGRGDAGNETQDPDHARKKNGIASTASAASASWCVGGRLARMSVGRAWTHGAGG